jgi:hypothetical protein
MKRFTKLFLVVAMLVSTSQLSFSQIGFGPRLGLNLPVLVGVNTNAKFKPGLHIGGYVKLNLSEKVAFQPELLFSMKGYSYKNASYSEAQSLNYIDLPLTLNIGKSQGIHFLFGVQPSFLIGAKYKVKIGNADATTTEDKDLFKGVDVGMLTALGYQLENGLNFDFRFSYGFIPVFENDAYTKLHNVNLQFSVGKTFGGQ